MAKETKDAYVVTVYDNGVGFAAPTAETASRSHVGIENVRKRLHTLSNGTLAFFSALGGGTTAVITLPKKGNSDELFDC